MDGDITPARLADRAWGRAVFTAKELVAELPSLSAAASPPFESVEFGYQDFDPPCSEQSIRAFRGSKHDFACGLAFWVKTLQAQGWEGRGACFVPYAEAGLCEPISGAEFARLVAEHSSSLREPLPLFLLRLDDFRSGLRMYADWNDVAAVAELAEAFVAFYWFTTA
jgi:hypothetical protein